MATNLVTRSVDWTLVLLENTEPPTDEEWDQCLRLLEAYRPNFSKVKVLVVTDGGGPTPIQRRRLSDVSGGEQLRSAIVTPSMKVRFIVSSVALFLPGVASFSQDEMDGAYAHLKMDKHERVMAERALREMRLELTQVGPAPTQAKTKPLRRK